MNRWIIGMLMGSVLLFTHCEDDDDDDGTAQLEVEAITAAGTDFTTGDPVEGIDLNAATSAEDVPLDAVITITFSNDVDAATVSDSTIRLESDTAVVTTVSTDGPMVTLTPDGPLARGTTYTLTIDGSVGSSGGGTLGNPVTVSFNTAGRAEVEPPQSEGQVAYWPFDNNAEDMIGDFDATEEVDITYTEDRFGQPASAAMFNGTTSIIEVPEASSLAETGDFTLSFWVRVDSTDHPYSHSAIGLGGLAGFQFEIPAGLQNAKLAAQYDLGETSASEDLWIDATGNLAFQGWVYSKDYGPEGGFAQLLQDNWVHFVFVYDSTSKVGSAYVNGELAKSQDFNLWPAEDAKRNAQGLTFAGTEPAHTGTLAFGFITDRATTAFDHETWGNYDLPNANHFKGSLDDVRIYHAALTEEEVANLYSGEAP